MTSPSVNGAIAVQQRRGSRGKVKVERNEPARTRGFYLYSGKCLVLPELCAWFGDDLPHTHLVLRVGGGGERSTNWKHLSFFHVSD